MRNAMKAADGMDVICSEDDGQLSVRAADIVARAVAAEPELLFCLLILRECWSCIPMAE